MMTNKQTNGHTSYRFNIEISTLAATTCVGRLSGDMLPVLNSPPRDPIISEALKLNNQVKGTVQK